MEGLDEPDITPQATRTSWLIRLAHQGLEEEMPETLVRARTSDGKSLAAQHRYEEVLQ